MKTKLKEKEKKRGKERRKEKKRRCAYTRTPTPSAHRAKALPLGHVEHTGNNGEMLLLKPSSLIKHEFTDIFQKNDCSLDSENPT